MFSIIPSSTDKKKHDMKLVEEAMRYLNERDVDAILRLIVTENTPVEVIYDMAFNLPQVVKFLSFDKTDVEVIDKFMKVNPQVYFYFNDNEIREIDIIKSKAVMSLPFLLPYNMNEDTIIPLDVVRTYVEDNPFMIKYLPEEIYRKDKEVMLDLLEIETRIYPYLTLEMKSDIDMVNKVLDNDYINAATRKDILTTLKYHMYNVDNELIMKAIRLVPSAVTLLSEDYRLNKNVILALMKIEYLIYDYLDLEMKEDEDIKALYHELEDEFPF